MKLVELKVVDIIELVVVRLLGVFELLIIEAVVIRLVEYSFVLKLAVDVIDGLK